ncbi:FtsX-like permease family protein [Kitasatospora sp. NPDC003701]
MILTVHHGRSGGSNPRNDGDVPAHRGRAAWTVPAGAPSPRWARPTSGWTGARRRPELLGGDRRPGVAATLVVSVGERAREIGVRRAIGMSRQQRRRMLPLEAVLLSLAGAGG